MWPETDVTWARRRFRFQGESGHDAVRLSGDHGLIPKPNPPFPRRGVFSGMFPTLEACVRRVIDFVHV